MLRAAYGFYCVTFVPFVYYFLLWRGGEDCEVGAQGAEFGDAGYA